MTLCKPIKWKGKNRKAMTLYEGKKRKCHEIEGKNRRAMTLYKTIKWKGKNREPMYPWKKKPTD